MKSDVKIDGNRLTISRVFRAPRAQVFDAWKQVETLQHWWGCAEATKVESQIDFRVGGSFAHTMQIQGCGEYVYRGTYNDIVEPERIAYSAQSRAGTERVLVEFIDQSEETLVIVTHDLPDRTACEMVSQGFSASFDKLDTLLAKTDTTPGDSP